MRLEDLMRPDLLEMEEYIPVEPLEQLSARLGLPLDKIVKLDANENPYGPSPAALEALRTQPFYHIYPDPSATALREELEKYTGVAKERIFVGSGSDELLELLIRLFITPGDNIIDFVPTFGMYSFLGNLYRAEVRSVPRHPQDYSLDLEAALKALDERTKLVFICTPNNPTGNPVPVEVVRALLETGKIVVVDEAYHDFAGHSFIGLTAEYDNLVVLRTFSKLSGLAGLRVGYSIMPEAIARQLWKIKQPYNVTVAGQEAARASLREGKWIEEHVRLIVEERARLFGLLQEFSDFFEALPSASNFIFCRLKQGNARQVKLELEKRGVLVRHYNKPLLDNAFRVSVGRPDQTGIFIEQLRQILYTLR
jgi:histidinol-phosphate aminotransferase